MTLIRSYDFNELSKKIQDDVIDKKLNDLLSEIFYLPNIYEYPEYIGNKLDCLFEEVNSEYDFIDEAKQNEEIFHYFRNIVIHDLKDCYFVNKLQEHPISKTQKPVILID